MSFGSERTAKLHKSSLSICHEILLKKNDIKMPLSTFYFHQNLLQPELLFQKLERSHFAFY